MQIQPQSTLLPSSDGLLYGFFGAFPWIYHGERGWSSRIASLPFIGVGIGILFGIGLNMHLNKSYVAKTRAAERQLPPEARLVLCCAGGVALPFGLMLFAWTTYSGVHWIAGVLATIPFGFGLVAVFLSMTVSTYSYLYWETNTTVLTLTGTCPRSRRTS